ncbi:MAG: serine hydrolase domain-containing protein, partial [Panacibacter sp.]
MIRIIYFLISFIAICSCGQSPATKTAATVISSTDTADSFFNPLPAAEIKKYEQEISDYYDTNFSRTGFNGSILVAKNGQVLFEDYKGTYNFATGEAITEHTPFHLASISKTFTGMTVLKLWEEGRISLDDSLQKFFPKLPYKGVTVKMLLNHRSGLPNYLYFMDSFWNRKTKATNWDVVNFMIAHRPPIEAMPGKSYHYSNTNFMLLALIVEIVTQESFPVYMKDSVFVPLGLKDSYVFSITDTSHYIATYSVTKPFPMDHLDCTYGDKNIYSTVRDLFEWDKALYKNTFLKKSTTDMAFTPYSNERKSMHNYGLAWHLYFNGGDTVVYHNGKWHGSNTSFTRLVQDTATIIVLGNKVNNNIYR